MYTPFVYQAFLSVDVTIIGELKPTEEQIDRAKRLQLPPTFYLYESKEPCKGCRGCREDLVSIPFNERMFNEFSRVVSVRREVPYRHTISFLVTLSEGLNLHDIVALLENPANFPSGFFPSRSLNQVF
jgi:hypothetical protein